MMKKNLLPLLAIFAMVTSTGLAISLDAQACSPAEEELSWTLPSEGDTVVSDVEILMGFTGMVGGSRDTTITDEAGVEYGFSEEYSHLARIFQGIVRLQPDGPLPSGTYTVSVEYPQNSYLPDFQFSFTVDDQLDAGPLPGAVNFQWYQETYSENTGDSCYYTDEYNQLVIDPLDEDFAYYEITFLRDNKAHVIDILRPSDVNGGLKGFTVDQVNCVRVAAVLPNGVEGDVVEHCVPDKCIHYEDPLPWQFGTTDWDELSGCGDDDNGNDGGNGNGNGNNDDNNGDDEDDTGNEMSDHDYDDDLVVGCITASGTTPPAFFIIFAALSLLVLYRRRRLTSCLSSTMPSTT